MSQTRFEEIKRYFHVSPLDSPKVLPCGRRLWHGKVDLLLTQLREASQKYRTPQSNITIDEAMIRFMGRSVDICKMPSKPIEIGYKFHCLADHGYVWDFWPQSGTKDGYDPLPPTAIQPTPGGLTPTGAMCLHLAKQLPYQAMAFNLYTDNYYTTLDLLSNLRSIGIGGCGTTRKDRTGYPATLKVPDNAQAKVEYHFITGAVNRGVATILWFDNAPVSLMSTIHSLVGRRSVVKSICKKPTRSNPKVAQTVFRDNSKLELDIPTCIADYNCHKVGVDVADQYRSYYSTQLTTLRNWFPIFFWVLDTLVINFFIIYRDLDNFPGLSHKEFRLQVAWQSILSRERRDPPSSKYQPHPAAAHAPPPTPLPGPLHLPIYCEPQERRICHFCRLERNAKTPRQALRVLPKSQWKCSQCSLHFCLNSSRNCFYIFHKGV